jgi:heme/copper-type cytochrome/quinol oxidase subunit 2
MLWLFSSIWYSANENRVNAGFAAHLSGDLHAMRRFFLRAVSRNPFLLCNRRIVELLVKSFFGKK